jgi:hypothetical protein
MKYRSLLFLNGSENWDLNKINKSKLQFKNITFVTSILGSHLLDVLEINVRRKELYAFSGIFTQT